MRTLKMWIQQTQNRNSFSPGHIAADLGDIASSLICGLRASGSSVKSLTGLPSSSAPALHAPRIIKQNWSWCMRVTPGQAETDSHDLTDPHPRSTQSHCQTLANIAACRPANFATRLLSWNPLEPANSRNKCNQTLQ